MIAPKRRMKAVIALTIFANDNSGLVVSDLDDIRFGHVSFVADGNAGIL